MTQVVANPGLGATDPLADAQAQLATVSAYLNAAANGTATTAQLQAAVAALTTAQTDVLNAQAKITPGALPPGMWVKGSAVAGVAAASAVGGGIAGWLLGRKRKATR